MSSSTNDNIFWSTTLMAEEIWMFFHLLVLPKYIKNYRILPKEAGQNIFKMLLCGSPHKISGYYKKFPGLTDGPNTHLEVSKKEFSIDIWRIPDFLHAILTFFPYLIIMDKCSFSFGAKNLLNNLTHWHTFSIKKYYRCDKRLWRFNFFNHPGHALPETRFS